MKTIFPHTQAQNTHASRPMAVDFAVQAHPFGPDTGDARPKQSAFIAASLLMLVRCVMASTCNTRMSTVTYCSYGMSAFTVKIAYLIMTVNYTPTISGIINNLN